MWGLVRPDSVDSLETSIVKKALPNYIKILKGEDKPKFQKLNLKEKINQAYKILNSCQLCERKCKVNRNKELGFCKVGNKPIISSAFVHLGEEPMLVPSFTIFFMGCTFNCQFCQNWEISQWKEHGNVVSVEDITIMINESKGCRNVNFVGGEPTPHLPFILDVLKGVKIKIPVVWNSNFYMGLESMGLLQNVVDVYLSDWKYWNNTCAKRLSKVENYLDIIKRNHDLAFKDAELVIRHLILPNHFECCTKPILNYIAENYSDKAIVNIMAQYRPEYKAHEHYDISKHPNRKELEMSWNLAEELALSWIR